MKAYGLTDVGKQRSTNQDYIFSSSTKIGSLPNLFIVADGMGGHKAGDYASRFIVENLVTFVQCSSDPSAVSLLGQGITEVNKRLFKEALKDNNLLGMGSTLVAAVVESSAATLYVANVGDSRLYLIRDHIMQITRDHSYVEELVQLGQLKRDSQDYRDKKNIITRAVGTGEGLEADFFEVHLEPGDYLLLCSDGLTNMVEECEIERIVLSEGGLEEKAEMLITSANIHGGKDNIAVILVEPQVSEVSVC